MSTLNAVPFRSTIFYTAAGTLAPAGSILTVAANGTQNFTSTLSAISFSTMAGSTISVSSIVGTTTLGQNPSFPNRFIELGTDAANTMYLDFHSSDAALPDYSTRIQSLGGATNGSGALNMMASTIGFSASNGVGIGTTSPTSVFTVNNAGAYRTHHLMIQGQEFYGAGNSSTGVAINIGVNRITNKQLWLMDPDLPINNTNGALRFILGSTTPQFGAVSTDGTTAVPLYFTGSLFNFPNSVGIGTATPARNLHVYGDGARVRIETGTANNSVLELKTNSNISYLFTDQTGHLQIYPGSTSNYLLLQPSGGNVGIGTAAPSTKLHIYQDTTSVIQLQTSAPDNSYIIANYDSIVLASNYSSSGIITNVGRGSSQIVAYSPTAGGYITFTTSPSINTAVQERMRITSVGSVGIGTNAPTARLSIYQDGISLANEVGTHSFGILSSQGTSGTNQMYMMLDADYTNQCCSIQSIVYGLKTWNLVLNPRGGNVGIGITNPALQFSVGSTYGVLNAVAFSLTAPSSVDSGLILVAGGMYIVSVTTAGNTFGSNNQWYYHGIVLFNVSGVSGYVPTALQSNNITISVAGTGRVTVTTPGGSGTNSYSICAVRVC